SERAQITNQTGRQRLSDMCLMQHPLHLQRMAGQENLIGTQGYLMPSSFQGIEHHRLGTHLMRRILQHQIAPGGKIMQLKTTTLFRGVMLVMPIQHALSTFWSWMSPVTKEH